MCLFQLQYSFFFSSAKKYDVYISHTILSAESAAEFNQNKQTSHLAVLQSSAVCLQFVRTILVYIIFSHSPVSIFKLILRNILFLKKYFLQITIDGVENLEMEKYTGRSRPMQRCALYTAKIAANTWSSCILWRWCPSMFRINRWIIKLLFLFL